MRRSQLTKGPEELFLDLVDRLLPTDSEEDAMRHKKALLFLFTALDPLRPLLETLTGLQTALQSVCEGLILVDRLAALNMPSASIVKVADQVYTPRCFALIARK